MGKIFNVEDRQNALDYLISSADPCFETDGESMDVYLACR